MELPKLLEDAINEQIKNISISELKSSANAISNRYMNEKRTGKTLLNKEVEALAYAVIRMPATYAADMMTLKYTFNTANCKIDTVIDVGSGTGAMAWAISNTMKVKNINCLDRENVMSNLAKCLMKNTLTNVSWENIDILKEDIKDTYDLVTASYVLNELSKEDRINVIDKLYKTTNKILLIVEPGTMEGFEIIKKAKEYAIDKGAYIIAPCTNQDKCKLPENDWCHATVRVQRNKMHKYMKNAVVPYEDEKFTYIAISKQDYGNASKRILRHPIIEKGKITLKICNCGNIEELIVTKKDKEKFKLIKKKKCGDEI